MKKIAHILLAIMPSIILTSTISSCRKTESIVGTAATTKTEDTLSQSTYTVSRSNATDDGIILMCPAINSDSSELMVMDGAGHLLKRKYTIAAACFNRWNLNGKIRYTWIENDPTAFHAYPDMIEGQAIVANENLDVLQRISLQPYNDITAASPYSAVDMHDFILLSDNHYLVMAYYPKTVQNIPASLNPQSPVSVVAPIIQEVQDGQVIWQWDGSNYPEFYSTSVEGNNYYATTVPLDYMHMNSMFIDPKDNNLICSFRNLDQIIKINRQTGAIMWRLGGNNSDFPLTTDQTFFRQHNATLTDNNQTLLLFDNGIAGRGFTRVLEFGLNETGKQVATFKQFTIPEPQSLYMGSAQKIGNHYFIGGGTAGYALEVDYTTGEKIVELKGPVTYRAYKY